MFTMSLSKLKDLFSSKSEFAPTNALEIMISKNLQELDPRRFFELFQTREVLLLLGPGSTDTNLKLVTTPQIKGMRFAYIFTSADAFKFANKVKAPDSREFVHVTGKQAMEFALSSGLGLTVNQDVGDLFIIGPENIRYALSELSAPTPVKIEELNVPQGTHLYQGIPSVMPVKKLNALVEFLKQTPQIEKIIFSLVTSQGAGDQQSLAYCLGVLPSHPGKNLSEIAPILGQIWFDIQEDDESFPDYPTDMQVITPEMAEAQSQLLVTVTKNGWVDPQG